MSVDTATQGLPHLPSRSVGLALAGVALVGASAFGVSQLMASGSTVIATDQPGSVITDGARDSWEGRISPAPVPGTELGVRDSWMPPGTTSSAK